MLQNPYVLHMHGQRFGFQIRMVRHVSALLHRMTGDLHLTGMLHIQKGVKERR